MQRHNLCTEVGLTLCHCRMGLLLQREAGVPRTLTSPNLCATCPCRNIDKAGGLDSYILTTNDKKLDSDLATQLKMEMMERMLAKQHSQQRRQAAAVTGMSPAAAQLAAGAGAPEEPAPSPPAS